MAEDLQSASHLGDLVVAADFHLLFQLAGGHAAHPGRQDVDAVQQDAADEEPADEQGAADADDADGN